MAEHGLDRLEVGAAGQGEGGSAVPEVVEPDRGQSLPAYKLGEPAGQVPGRVGTSARAGEDVPVAPRGHRGVGQPLYGPPAGIGIGQLDPASLLSPDQYWGWQVNLKGGIALFHAKLRQAQAWANSEHDRLSSRLTEALDYVNTVRTEKGLPTITMEVITVPPLSDEQAIRYYNGGNEFHFDADYVVSHNNLNVELVGTGRWVGGTDPTLDGVHPSPAGKWGHASGNLQLSQR